MAAGSGELLNEGITGDLWPLKHERNERLLECAEIMRRLWAGQEVTKRGHSSLNSLGLSCYIIYMPMLIDLHTHTRRGSGCSRLHTKDLVLQALEMHLDAICVTDHNTTKVVERAKERGEELGLLVLGGVEVRCREGDVLVFGLQESPPPGILAQSLVKFVHFWGGVAIPAHPFRASAPSLGKKICEVQGFDAIEVLNGNSSPEENRRSQEAAEKLGLPGTGGSDSHSRKNIGRCVTEFDDVIKNEVDLVAAIKSGRCRPKRLFYD